MSLPVARLLFVCCFVSTSCGCYLSHTIEAAPDGGEAPPVCVPGAPTQMVLPRACAAFDLRGGDECSTDPATHVRVQRVGGLGFGRVDVTPTTTTSPTAQAGYRWRFVPTCDCSPAGFDQDPVRVGVPMSGGLGAAYTVLELELLNPAVTYHVEVCNGGP